MPVESEYVDAPLARWAHETPDADCMTYGDRTWSFGQFHDRVRRGAGGLRELGIGRGDVVAFLDKNHPACVEVSLAAASIGAANAVVNWRLAPDEVDFTLDDCGARVLFVGTELLETVRALDLPQVERIIEVAVDGADEYEAFLGAATPLDRDPEVTPDDTCLLLYSSGTTGRPKGVMLTHRNMAEHTVRAHDGWGFEPGDKNLVAMPLFHVGGSSYVLFGLYDGVPSIMTREPDAAALGQAILAGANRMFLVPAVLAQVISAGHHAIEVFSRLKTFTYGASPMPPPLLRAAMKTWPECDFLQVYGLTEVAGVATHLLPDEHRQAEAEGHPERLLSAGRPIPGMEVRISSLADDTQVPPNEAGEIWLRSKQIMKGFWNRPAETGKVMTHEGWFRTGDIGRIDEDGFLYVEDRLKDMIISGGENIYSPEVERVLVEHPAVAECAVVGVPDERWGETVRAVVSLKPGTTATEAELIELCRERLAHYKAPRSVVFLDALPRNPTGKILKRSLRAAGN